MKYEDMEVCKGCKRRLPPKAFNTASGLCHACIAFRAITPEELAYLRGDRYNKNTGRQPRERAYLDGESLPSHKRCVHCLEWEELVKYHRAVGNKYGRASACPKCATQNTLRHRSGMRPLKIPDVPEGFDWYMWQPGYKSRQNARTIEKKAAVASELPKEVKKQQGMSEELKQRLAAMQAHLRQHQIDMRQQKGEA